MPEPKLSPAQFAARIKSQYPEYKDIADDVLAQKIVSKYPEYAESVDFGVKKKRTFGFHYSKGRYGISFGSWFFGAQTTRTTS